MASFCELSVVVQQGGTPCVGVLVAEEKDNNATESRWPSDALLNRSSLACRHLS